MKGPPYRLAQTQQVVAGIFFPVHKGSSFLTIQARWWGTALFKYPL